MTRKFYIVLMSGSIVIFLSIGALLARNNPKDTSYTYLSIFSNVVHLVDSNYVDSVDFNKVMDSAINGMVENLDPDSFYIRGNEVDSYKKMVEEDKSKAGVGMTLVKRMGMVVVAAVDKGSSAEEKKIKVGDYIRSIDNEYVQMMPLYKVYHALKGAPGTEVHVSMFRSAMEKPEDFVLVRRQITRPYIQSFIAQPKIGYIHVQHLLPGVETEIETKLSSFQQQGVQRMILDLRGCTEENTDVAVKVTDLFVGAVPILQISGRDGLIKKINGESKIAYKGDVLVVTDFTTLSGAEIIAGAIQDSGSGKAFGLRTFGRGGIQKLLPAGPNWVVLTTQKYLTPKGRMILNNGIEPVLPYKEDTKTTVEKQPDADPLLDKALEYLRTPVAVEKAA